MIVMFVNKQRKYNTDQIEHFKSLCQTAMDEVVSRNFVDRSFRTKKTSLSATVTFVGSDYMKKTNQSFRGINSLTDVLSFPLLDMKDGKLVVPLAAPDILWHQDGVGEISLGDVLISLDKASDQAKEIGQSLDKEVSFLAVHAMLHLLGFDHIDSESEKRMIAEQKKIMDKLDISDNSESDFEEKPIHDYSAHQIEHSGFAAIIGRPNVGKSTLLNKLSGMKLAIISHKPQTTRNNIRAIVNRENTQIIFVDTPGIHNPKSELAKMMVESSSRASKDSDVVLLMVDGRFSNPAEVEREAIRQAEKHEKPLILVVNKTDIVTKESILPIIKHYSALYDFKAIVPVSAFTGDGLNVLLDEISKLLPPGPRYFPEEEFTDQSERELAAEFIREQILHYTNEEIPHGTAVSIDKYEENVPGIDGSAPENEIVKIYASIICEKSTHKSILLGKSGQMIKRIGSAARVNIEKMTGCKVYLEIHVKVREDWKNRTAYLNDLGYRKGEH